jgi:outer membrane protein assembly factor BamB
LIGAAYENGKLFVVPTGGVSGGGAMFAYDALSGKELWSANLPGQYSFSSAPTAYAGVVYTGGAGSGGTVYAVRETDGLLLWTGSVENGDSSAPAVTPDGVFVSYACPQTYRFALHSGKLDWNYSGPCEGGGGESAAVYRGQVYVRDVLGNYSTDGIRLAESTGALLGGFNSTYSPAFEGLTAFYTEPNTLTALNLVTGHARWTAVAPAGQQFSCAPIVVNDAIYEATAGSELYGYNIDTGRMLFAAALPQAVTCGEYFSTPLVGLGAGDGILVVPAGDFLIAFD